MRSQFASLRTLVLPFGATSGTRIVINGITGTIQFYDSTNTLVGLLSPELWYAGDQDAAHVALDPFGGFRVYDDNGLLVALLNAEGLQLSDPTNLITPAILSPYDLLVTDPSGSVQMGILDPLPGSPRYGGSTETNPGTTLDTPSVNRFTTNDIELRHMATAEVGVGSSEVTFTPPAGYTEEVEGGFTVTNIGAISTTIASRQPAVSNAVRTFTASVGDQDYALGVTVVVKGTVGGTAPSIRGIVSPNADDGTQTSKDFSVTKLAGTAAGDVMVTFVSVLNATGTSLPTSWSTPTGWKFLGAQFLIGASSSYVTGVFYKIATASEPATYDFTINTGTGHKIYKIRAAVIQDAFTNAAGPDIQINGDSIGRGIVAQFSSTAAAGPYTGDTTTDMVMNNVPVVAGRTYAIHLHALCVLSAAGARWLLRARVNGSTEIGVLADVVNTGDTVMKDGTVYWTAPTTQATDDFEVFADETAGAGDLTISGTAASPRWFTITDVGIVD